MSRQNWSTGVLLGILLLYILADISGKLFDKSITSATIEEEAPQKTSAAVVQTLVRTQEAHLEAQSLEVKALTEQLKQARAMLNQNSLRGGCPGAMSSTEGETSASMTARFLQADFPYQATVPPAQCIAGIGVPGADTPTSRKRRAGQRETWHTYEGVRNGQVTVRYLLAKHPTNQYQYTQEAIDEAKTHQDVYALKMREGVPTQRHEGQRSGYWGFTAALGISRKGLLWYRMGAYYNCSYVLKGDDDMYWNVPQYLHDIQQLPKTHMMWGKGMHYGCRKKSVHCVYFVVGMVLTMSRDVAMAITHVKDFIPWADAVEADDREESLTAIKDELQAWTFDHEDVLVGRLLRESGLNITVYDDFRFHDCGVGFLIKPVNKWSVVMHRCGDWTTLRSRFTEETVIDWKLILEPWLWKQDHRIPIVDRGTFIGFEHRVRYQFLQRVHPPGEPKWD